MNQLLLASCLVLSTAGLASAQTVFIVRHAEGADAAGGGAAMMAADPELSAAGGTRAESLAAALVDAGVTVIFATEYKRTQQTAAPLAKRLGLGVVTVPGKDTAALVAQVRSAKGNVLVVGHSDTVPEIVRALGVETPVTIAGDDYDNLFVVTLDPRPGLVRLHYR